MSTSSVTASGALRRWMKIDDFMQEVANARIYDGVHYRTSTEVGAAMGEKLGELAVSLAPQPLKMDREGRLLRVQQRWGCSGCSPTPSSQPENLPRWATGLGGNIENVNGEWIAASPSRRIKSTL